MWWKKIRRSLLPAVIAGALAFLAWTMYHTYGVFTGMVIEQQQEHLLVMTRAVTQNLELSLSEQVRQVEILTHTNGFLDAMEEYDQTGELGTIKEYIFSYILSDQRGPSRMYLLNADGEQVFHYNQYPFLEDFDEGRLNLERCAEEGQNGIGGVFPMSSHHYGMTLVNNIYGGNGYLGAIVSVMDLQRLYEQYVEPLDVDGIGDIIVKDADGTILMHPSEQVIGFNQKRDIPDFQDLNQYRSLREMLKKQYSQEEGTAVWQSYYNGILPAQRDICAFSRMNLWGTSWYVSVSMPYSRAIQLETRYMRQFGLLVGGILAVLAAGTTCIYVLARNRQKLELETQYLKEINQTLEELNESREEARHYHKLMTVGALAGSIVHEFNNLLTPILGYSEFLCGQLGEDSEYRGDVEEIHKAGLRAKEIVEQILPFSRKEGEASSYGIWNLDVLIRDSLKTIRVIMPSTVQVVEDLQDGGANLYGSANQIHQVLLNLYANAIQSMGQEGTLTVRTARVERWQLPEAWRKTAPADEYVEIRVQDNGCGIAPEILGQIFNPFFTTKESGEGTGLGLSMVKDILISHSAFIFVESQLGEGSCFYIYIPPAGRSALPDWGRR